MTGLLPEGVMAVGSCGWTHVFEHILRRFAYVQYMYFKPDAEGSLCAS